MGLLIQCNMIIIIFIKIRHNEFINGLVFNWDFRIYS